MPESSGTFGTRLRTLRHGAGLSQSELCARVDIPKSTLSRYENDHVLPSITTLGRLAEGLGVPDAALLPGPIDPEAYLLQALRDRGVRIRSIEDAERIATLIARSSTRRSRRTRVHA